MRCTKYSSVTPLYKQINLLKLEDIYKYELGKLMYQLHREKLPDILANSFTKLESIHSYPTRRVTKTVYYLSRVTKKFAQNQLSYRGVKLWDEINSDIKNLHWSSFKKELKNFFINQY